jgi:RNA polymerase sigma factor (TIGR02999 family)
MRRAAEDGPVAEESRDRAARLLAEVRVGKRTSLEALLPLVYEELKGIAASYMRRERGSHTLQPTALVNEACIRMLDAPRIDAQDRQQFLALAARVMRQVLVDHARRHDAQKRGGAKERVTLSDDVGALGGTDLDVLALDEALTRLAALDPRKAQVVELRFFAGMTSKEAGAVLGVSETTAEDDWYMARAWLRDRLA